MSRLAWPYCVVPADHEPPKGLRGVADAPVRLLAVRDLGVWASPIDRPPAADVGAIRVHNAVVQAAAGGAVTPVPIRFGQCAPPRELRRRIAREAGDWRGRLDRLAGTTEFGLLLLGDPVDDAQESAPTSGRDYLARAAERHRRERTLDPAASAGAAALREHVGALALEETIRPVPGRTGAARIAHLVAVERADEYAAIVQRFIATSAQRFVLTGPWPPWSFAR